MGESAERHMRKALELLGDARRDMRVAVPVRRRPPGRDAVDELAPVRERQPRAAGRDDAPPQRQISEPPKAPQACKEKGSMRCHFTAVPVHGSAEAPRELNTFLGWRTPTGPRRASSGSGCAVAGHRH